MLTWIAAHLGVQLEDYVRQHLSGIVRLIRTKQREGLIRARIFGADHATGDVSNSLQSFNISLCLSLLDRTLLLKLCPSVRLSNACIVTKRKHLAKKVQLWLIGSRLWAFQWTKDEQRTLPLNPAIRLLCISFARWCVLYVPVVERTHHNYMPAFRLSVTLWRC